MLKRQIKKVKIKAFAFALATLLLAGSTSGAAADSDVLAAHRQLSRAEIQAAIDKLADAYGAIGAEVAVIRGGSVDDTYAYGSATKGVRAMTADTRIRVASISKVVLAMVAMRLKDDGVIDPDADLSRYWGAAVRNPRYENVPVTIRSLLSHTSSIGAFGKGTGRTGAAVRRNLTSGAAFNRSVPGSIGSWCYNNYGFAVLGLTLELASRETVNSIAERELFGPLNIRASFGYVFAGGEPPATLYHHDGNVAQSIDAQKRMTGNTYPGQSGIRFPGGLMISAADLAKLVAVLANDGLYKNQRLLSSDSVAFMETLNPKKVPNNPFYQGLPLRCQEHIYAQNKLYYHSGSSYGAYHLISYNPETKNGVVVLTTGASAAKDAHGIYKVCGEISRYIYGTMGA